MKDFTIRPLWALVAIASALLLITSAGVFYTRQVQQNTVTLKATVTRLDETRQDVLCPLYGLFLASYDPKSEQARADPKRYEQAFAVIRHGAQHLNCPVVVR